MGVLALMIYLLSLGEAFGACDPLERDIVKYIAGCQSMRECEKLVICHTTTQSDICLPVSHALNVGRLHL